MRYAEKMAELTTCEICEGECTNASGICHDCQTPDWEHMWEDAYRGDGL